MSESSASPERPRTARTDERILEAAREVFLADPSAPIAAVADRAGVGMSALYRRYDGKDDLLRALARDGLTRYRDDVRTALAETGSDADTERTWTAYTHCLARVVDGRSQALAQRLAGTFEPTADLDDLARAAADEAAELHRRAQAAGALRPDVSGADVTLILETVAAIDVPDPAWRRRFLVLLVQALRAPAPGALPGRAAEESDLAARWRRRDRGGPGH